MKVSGLIFIDFDGVINNHNSIRAGEEHLKENYSDFSIPNISYSNIVPFTELLLACKRDDIKIVISSMWKFFGLNYCISALKSVFPAMLVDDVVIGCTPDTVPDGKDRTSDIAAYVESYIKEHNLDGIPHIAIDDNEDIFVNKDADVTLIKVDPKIGLTSSIVTKAIHILKEKVYRHSANNRHQKCEFYNKNITKIKSQEIINSNEEKSTVYKYRENTIYNLKYILNKFKLHDDVTILNRLVRFEFESSDFNATVPCGVFPATECCDSEDVDPYKLFIVGCAIEQASKIFSSSDMRDMRLCSFIDSVNKALDEYKAEKFQTYSIKDITWHSDKTSNNKHYKFGTSYLTDDNTYIIFKLIEI